MFIVAMRIFKIGKRRWKSEENIIKALNTCQKGGMMHYCKALRTIVIILVAGCMVCFSSQPTPIWAGGLYLQEFGTPSMGVASAGAEAVAVDASTAWHNPAGMTRLDGKQLMVVGGLAYSRVKFDQAPGNIVSGGNGGDAGGPAPIGGAFYSQSLSENLKLGISLYSISGALLDYDNSWVGRYQCQEVSIFTVTMNPSIAYRVNDWLSIGGGPAVVYGELDLEVAAPPTDGTGKVELDGDDWEVGFNGGILVDFNERTRLGLLYFSGWNLEFSGDIKIQGLGITAGTDTELDMPQMVRLGAYHEINNRLALLGTVAWEEWSDLDKVNISTGSGGAALDKNWDDVWHFAAGIHYRLAQPMLLQFGIAYDTSPVDSDDRTADMPIDRQIRYACGVQYEYSDNVTLGTQFEYIDMGDAEIEGVLLNGDYKTNEIYVLAINVNWKF